MTLTRADAEVAAARVYRDNFRALTKELRKSQAKMFDVVEQVLVGVGLIRATAAGWTILPVAARYRDARAIWEPTLEDMAHDDG